LKAFEQSAEHARAPADSARRSWTLSDRQVWTAAPFLVLTAVCAVFAFVGLSASSYWMDELFTLFVVDHGLGLHEVLARALTDTHPPAYYFALYEWIQVFGSSEAATRLFSAILAVAALVALFVALRGALSLPARSFAVALSATSRLFFYASDTARSYAICILLSAILLGLGLALQRRLARREAAPVGLWVALGLVSLLAEYTHFYSFLVVGMTYFYLLLQARSWRDRAIVVASGTTLLALMSLYVVALLHASRQDLQHMWFSNSWSQIGNQALDGLGEIWSGTALVAVLVLAFAPWADRRRQANALPAPAPPAVSPAPRDLSALVIAGVLLSGITVSFLIAPSFGTRNLYVLGPYFWALGGWLFDAVGPDLRRRPSQVLVGVLALLIALAVLPVRARTLSLNEEWRASAAVVAAEPGCAGQDVPVVLPFIFGPSTPFFRQLAKERFFGRYFPEPARLRPYPPEAFALKTADPQLKDLLQARAQGGCPLLAWGVHDVDPRVALQLSRDIAETSGLPSARVRVREVANRKLGMFGDTRRKPQAFVFERLDPPPS
jgi:hypothetical protein